MIEVIAHADWSVSAAKRWVVWARRTTDGWRVDPPQPVREPALLVEALLAARAEGGVLAGFDFPIGLPLAYGRQTGLADFREALAAFGTAPGWKDAYCVAARAAEVNLRRPFFPRVATKGVRRSALWQGLGLGSDGDLFRLCERAGGPGLRQACPLFWTLGANQVGRAAIAGWRAVIGPLIAAGATLWPFDAPLDRLAAAGGLILAETYPADAYARLDAAFGPRTSKRRQADRAARAHPILKRADAWHIDLTACREDLIAGYGPSASGEDMFDALVGALAMIATVAGELTAMPDGLPGPCLVWEGWIIGRPRPRDTAGGRRGTTAFPDG